MGAKGSTKDVSVDFTDSSARSFSAGVLSSVTISSIGAGSFVFSAGITFSSSGSDSVGFTGVIGSFAIYNI